MENKAPRQADHPEEILDLVNEQDEIIGSLTRKEIYAQGLRNYRVVHAFIVNDEGKFWIPRRASTKNCTQTVWITVLPDMLNLEKRTRKHYSKKLQKRLD